MATTAFDLTSDLTTTLTVSDPADVTVTAPDGARGAVTVVRAGVDDQIHTYKMLAATRSLPADWFEVDDDVTVERWAE
jgi:hypothetical protein